MGNKASRAPRPPSKGSGDGAGVHRSGGGGSGSGWTTDRGSVRRETDATRGRGRGLAGAGRQRSSKTRPPEVAPAESAPGMDSDGIGGEARTRSSGRQRGRPRQAARGRAKSASKSRPAAEEAEADADALGTWSATSEWVTAPCSVQDGPLLAASAASPAPVWSSFMGHCSGVWVGAYCAFDAEQGMPEAVCLDANGDKMFELCTRAVEEEAEAEDGQASLLRTVTRGRDIPACLELAADGRADAASLAREDPGFLYFDGGSYSCSALTIGTPLATSSNDGSNAARDADAAGPDEDDEEEAEAGGGGKVSLLEHCLAVSGSRRVRVQILLESGGGGDSELDCFLLRLVLYKEHWLGPAEMRTRGDIEAATLADDPRARVARHVGDWHALQLSAALAHPVPDVAPVDGHHQGAATELAKLYFSREVSQRWSAAPAGPSDAGVTWWLPHGVSVTLTMVPVESRRGSKTNLVARTTWQAPDAGFLSVMETEYNHCGRLLEARFSTLVPATNSIPSMNKPVVTTV